MAVTEPRSRVAELLLALFVLAAGIGTAILFGVQRFTEAQQARAQFELRSRLFLARLEACRTLADVTGHLVAEADEPGFPDALRDFRARSRGPLELVADEPLDRALDDFELSAGEFQNRRIEVREFRQRAELLIRSCRCSVDRTSWKPEDGRPVPLAGACRGIPAAAD
jgi:hypothetical protein